VTVELQKELGKFMREHGPNGCLTTAQQEEFARHLVEQIRKGAGNKYIKGFLKHTPNGIDAARNWWNTTGNALPKPDFTKVAAIKIKGIAFITVPKVIDAATAWVRRVPGGKYALSAVVAAIVYNNARADGHTITEASAFAAMEAVNPFPIGPDDLRQVGKWASGQVVWQVRGRSMANRKWVQSVRRRGR
jgi:hypothetical protein